MKNDFHDARLIAKTLCNGDYSEVFVPTPEDEAVAHLLSHRDNIRKEIVQVKNQMQALLTSLGFKCEETKTKWTEPYVEAVQAFIEKVELKEDKFVLNHQMTRYQYLCLELDQVDEEIEEVAEQEKYAQDVANLRAIKGVETLTALNIVITVGDIKRFASADSFANYLGLTPGEHSSGERQNQQGITKMGNARLRRLFVLSAQTYSRGNEYYKSKPLLERQKGLDPELVNYADKGRIRCRKKFKHLRDDLHKNYNVAVCAVARELACFCWGILSGNIR